MRALIGILAVLAAAVGLWLWTTGGADVAPLAERHAGTPPVGLPSLRAAQAAGVTGAAGSEVTTVPTEGARQAVGPDLEGQPWNVRVVEASTGKPLAGALVHYLPPEFDYNAQSAELLDLLQSDTRAWFEQAGEELLSDSQGRCKVPLPEKHGAQFAASHGELFDFGFIRNDAEEPTVVALRPDRALNVLVVGADGRPVEHADVEFVRERAGEEPTRFNIGQTGADGRVVKRHVQTFVSESDGDRMVVQVIAKAVGCDSEQLAVDLCAPPPELVLHLPSAGSVTVRLVDVDGEPLDQRYLAFEYVGLKVFEGHPTREQEHDRANIRGQARVPIREDSTASFSHVAFDRYVVAQVHTRMTSRGAGPTLAQPHVEFVVREPEGSAIVVGRLLRADGSPFANELFTLTALYDHGQTGARGRTDDDGRLRCNAGKSVAGRKVTLSCETAHRNPSLQGERLSARVGEVELVAGKNDIGDVTLAPLGVMVAGKLVCGPGVEIDTVRFRIEQQIEERWRDVWNVRPEWQDGAFEARGSVPAGTPLRLKVQEGPYLPVEPIECVAGVTDLEIRLAAAGSVKATFLVGEGLPLDGLRVRFRSVDANPRPSMMERFREQPWQYGQGRLEDGRVVAAWQGLEPGSYRLTVLASGAAEPIVDISPIVVGGGACEDPRLVDIDLRSLLGRVEIRARKPNGEPLVDPSAFVVVQSGPDDFSGHSLRTGVVPLALPGSSVVHVVAPGFRTATVTAVVRSQEIALVTADEVEFGIEFDAELPADSNLDLRLVPVLGHSRRARITLDTGRGMMLSNFFRDEAKVVDGVARVFVRWPGEYRVEGRLGRYVVRGAKPSTVTLPGGETRLQMPIRRLLERKR